MWFCPRRHCRLGWVQCSSRLPTHETSTTCAGLLAVSSRRRLKLPSLAAAPRHAASLLPLLLPALRSLVLGLTLAPDGLLQRMIIEPIAQPVGRHGAIRRQPRSSGGGGVLAGCQLPECLHAWGQRMQPGGLRMRPCASTSRAHPRVQCSPSIHVGRTDRIHRRNPARPPRPGSTREESCGVPRVSAGLLNVGFFLNASFGSSSPAPSMTNAGRFVTPKRFSRAFVCHSRSRRSGGRSSGRASR